jgi:trk system potassium uptake protein TrkH
LKRKGTIKRLTPPQILVIGFAIIIFAGAVLLSLPISSTNGHGLRFIDALFTATSATCVTGLVVVDTGTYFTIFGQVVIMILIQIGGLGFMTMSTLLALVLRKRISLKERLILQEAFNQGSMEGIVRLIRKVLLYSFTVELVGALLFALRWSFDYPLGTALYKGVFHAVSLFNNAGFDLSGSFASFIPYADDWMINLTAIALIVLGGIGFIVMSDLIDFRKKRKLTLHSKVVLSMTSFLLVFGAIVIFLFEYSNARTLGQLSESGKVLAAMLQSTTTRTTGVNSIDIGAMRQASQFFLIILMFIGASPGSTGGGIKTTTFTTLIGAMIAMMRGKQDIVLFRQRLAQGRIYKAITLTLLALFVVLIVAMVLSTTEDRPFLMILFETTSAFGTVGLSMGLTPDLTVFGKIMIMLTMFTGRLGLITLAYALQPKPEKELYKYPEGKILIG